MCREPWIGPRSRWTYSLLAMARPAFLLGTIPLYFVGVAAARRAGFEIDVDVLLLGLAAVLAVQTMTHYNNEYWDVEADRAGRGSSRLSGGSGVLAERLVPRRTARIAALASLGVVFLFTSATVLLGGAGTAFLGIVAVGVVAGWTYSAPPIRLVERGVGEVTIAGILGGLVPATGYLLQASILDASIVVVALPLVPLAFATSIATAIPDVAADGQTGKRTLPVRLGVRRAVVLVGAALVVGWLLFGHAVSVGEHSPGTIAFGAVLVLLTLFARSARKVQAGSTAAAERLALLVVLIFGWTSIATSVLLFVG